MSIIAANNPKSNINLLNCFSPSRNKSLISFPPVGAERPPFHKGGTVNLAADRRGTVRPLGCRLRKLQSLYFSLLTS
jgi:hypothetical protein